MTHYLFLDAPKSTQTRCSNNVRVENNDILTYGSNTDGCDPDSSWNVYIAGNSFSTGDDCIAIKAGG